MTNDLDVALRIRANIDQARRSLGQLKRLAVSVGLAFGGAFAVKKFVDAGIQFNSTLETSRLGIASLISAQSQLTDSTGRLLQGQEALQGALQIADDQVRKLRIAGIQTSATFEQLTEAYQQAIGPGLAAGLGLDQVRDITVQIVQAAGALGVPMNQVSQEVRAILEGSIDVNARIAKALDITNAMVKNWKDQGTLVAQLNKRLEAFKVAGEETAKTWESTKSNVADAVATLSGAATQPLFDSLKKAANEALNSIFNVTEGAVSKSLNGLISVLQQLAAGAGAALSGAISGVVSGAQALSGFLERNKAQVDDIITAVGRIGSEIKELLGPVGAVLVGLIKWAVQSKAVLYSLRTVELLVAGLEDGFTFLGALAAELGAKIIRFIALPFQGWLELFALAGDAIGLDTTRLKEMSAALTATAAPAEEAARNIIDGMAAGNTAVQQTIKSWQEQKKAIEAVGQAAAKVNKKPELPLPKIGTKSSVANSTGAQSRQKQIDDLLAKLREQKATFGQVSDQVAIYRLKLLGASDAELAQAKALTGSIAALRKKKQLQSEGTQLTQSLRTAQETYDAEFKHYRQLLDAGAISQQTFNRAVAAAKAQLAATKPATEQAASALDQFATQAARSIQGTLANFFDGFKGGLKGLVNSVADALQKIAAQIAAADLAKKLFGEGLASGQSSQLGGLVGQGVSYLATLFHSGGVVGSASVTRSISPMAFIGAPRFATGGVFGLGPDEMPAIVHKREEILTPGDPRHRRNGGLSARGTTVIQNITTPDAQSFRQSSAQIARDARLALNRGRG